MFLKSAQETEKRISEILAKNTAEIDRLTHRIQEEENAIKEASEEMEKAVQAEDLKAYQAAKITVLTAREGAEMCRKKLEQIKAAPMIPQAEYHGMIDRIMNEWNTLNNDKAEKIKALSDQAAKHAEDLTEALNHANGVLHTLQNTVYKNKDRTIITSGKPVVTQENTVQIAYTDVITWGRAGVECFAYPHGEKK